MPEESSKPGFSAARIRFGEFAASGQTRTRRQIRRPSAEPKERLTRNMIGRRRYLPMKDQPVLAAKMDLDLALQRCPSFQRLLAELERLLAETF